MKTRLVGFKATDDEFREIERIAQTLKLSKTDYLRAVAFGAPAPMSTPAAAPASAPAPDLAPVTARLETVESRIAEINAALLQSAESFNALLQNLNEFLRVPSFSEYRARAIADDLHERTDANSWLLNCLRGYYSLYRVMPDINNKAQFGSAPEGFAALYDNERLRLR